jgi:penicillin amidase
LNKVKKWLLYSILVAGLGGGGTLAYVVFLLTASLPTMDGMVTVKGLGTPVQVEFDRYGIPRIHAPTRGDAFRALGFVMARDRLFQMDLLRRQSAGRLAEVFGQAAVATDIEHRVLGFEQAAAAIAEHLPEEHKAALQAFADGVNSFRDNLGWPPFEFLLLGYRPDPWRITDSLLVVLGMFEMLESAEWQERMVSVMEKSLPADVLAFLTPDTDPYTQALLGTKESWRPMPGVPVRALSALLNSPRKEKQHANLVRLPGLPAGSNAWAVAGSKTADGRAILANDMHLEITVPNLWYRGQLRVGDVELGGVILPGTPLIIAGASRYLAWGLTDLFADALDLVLLELNPGNELEYRTPGGWERFEKRYETLKVKGAPDRTVEVKTTIWGPVATKLLTGQPVAIHWTALDPKAVDVGLLDIDRADSLEQGLAVMNRTGGPPVNVVLADSAGRIAWTIMGRIPVRRGFDGAVSRSWADGSLDWTGYIAPEELPRLIDPPQGFVVSANHRTVGKEYPHIIGHGFENGYRAYRITERLLILDAISEEDMLRLQLDTTSEFYAFYRDLALGVLTPQAIQEKPERVQLRDYLKAWDGQAEIESLGLGLLVRFREILAEAVLMPFLQSCQELESEFEYAWPYLDTPLQTLLTEKDPKLLPDRERYPDWDTLILARLEESARVLTQQYQVTSLRDLTWGHINVARFSHLLSNGSPVLGEFLNMPRDPLPGCGFCVRSAFASWGASERLVISPGHPENGILHIPGGQSGHPLSPHYRDQHSYWVEGLPLAFASGEPQHTLTLIPARHSRGRALSESHQQLTN